MAVEGRNIQVPSNTPTLIASQQTTVTIWSAGSEAVLWVGGPTLSAPFNAFPFTGFGSTRLDMTLVRGEFLYAITSDPNNPNRTSSIYVLVRD